MGSTHAVCQDYAVSGIWAANEDHPQLCYAALSDGCSGSSDTDFGARFLVKVIQRRLGELWKGSFPTLDIASEAWVMARTVGLSFDALDATLLTVVSDGRSATVHWTGDGVVAWRDSYGQVHYRSIEFGKGMPRYLSYSLNAQRHDALMRKVEGSDEAGAYDVSSNTFVPGVGWGMPVVERHQFSAATPYERKMMFCVEGDGMRRQADVVMLLSDGAESFQAKDGTVVMLEQVLTQLFDLKGFKGEFLVRRCNRFLQGFCAENGWRHTDDFSAVGVHLEEVAAQPLNDDHMASQAG